MERMTNPFFAPSTLPFQLPPFADIRDEHYRPGFERGFAEQLAEVETIVQNPEAPTVENTLVPLERSGQTLARVASVFFNKTSADSSDFTNALEEEIAPLLAAHEDAIRLNPKLYERIATLHERRDELNTDAETGYLIERYYTEYTLAGAGLDADTEGAAEGLQQPVVHPRHPVREEPPRRHERPGGRHRRRCRVDGLADGEISAAAQAASDRGLDGKYLITLVLPTGHPYLASLTNRAVRERIMAASRSRGGRGGEHDNRELVLEITRLRAERAKLLGFDSHAAFVTADETAKTPEAVAEMLGRLAPAAARNARAEQAALQQQIGDEFEVAAWDWAYYTEKVRSAKFDVDTAAMRPYFEAERVLHDGVFFAATALYGITFTERDDLVAYHPEARVFEVRNEDGSPVGLFVYDLYTRDSKRGGAWMNPLISQSELARASGGRGEQPQRAQACSPANPPCSPTMR